MSGSFDNLCSKAVVVDVCVEEKHQLCDDVISVSVNDDQVLSIHQNCSSEALNFRILIAMINQQTTLIKDLQRQINELAKK